MQRGIRGRASPRLPAAAAALLLLLALPAPAVAAPAPRAQQEIAGLMAALAGSHCQFQRNGKWHDAAEARRHLQRKYDYLLKRNLVDSAEQFIERAASSSSVSGREYRVRCAGQPERASAEWFGEQLRRQRAAGGTPGR